MSQFRIAVNVGRLAHITLPNLAIYVDASSSGLFIITIWKHLAISNGDNFLDLGLFLSKVIKYIFVDEFRYITFGEGGGEAGRVVRQVHHPILVAIGVVHRKISLCAARIYLNVHKV